jgi:hypothetical protein
MFYKIEDARPGGFIAGKNIDVKLILIFLEAFNKNGLKMTHS